MPIQRADTNEPRLTADQRLWLEFYLGRCKGDAVEAARLAGFSEDERALRRQAQRLLNNPNVRYHIEKWTSRHMAPMEILALLASHARGDMGDFWEISQDPAVPPSLNMRKAAELGLTHLIKKFKIGKDGAIEMELYDAQAALRDLMKVHQMHRQDSNVNVTVQHVLRAMPPEVRERALAAISARMGHALAGGNEESEEVIEAEVTSDDNQALAVWSPDTPLLHGLGDDREEAEDDV